VPTASSSQKEKALLKSKLLEMRRKHDRNLKILKDLKDSHQYQKVANIEDSDAYFEKAKRTLNTELEALQQKVFDHETEE